MSQQVVIAGYAAEALASLTPSQLQFLRRLPKAELHAHLNGCIPISVLEELASKQFPDTATRSLSLPEAVHSGIQRLQQGVVLNEIHDFFGLFPAIYALTFNAEALAIATRAVLSQFLDYDNDPESPQPQAAYLELRSTPRETQHMTRTQYLQTILDEVEKYPSERAALLVSLDRRMDPVVAEEIVSIAVRLRKEGRRVVGIDLCGDPLVRLYYYLPYRGLNLVCHGIRPVT
jgi:adenosine deaminase